VTALALLAKTYETFKLADLLYLEFRIQRPNSKRLVVDAATGSSVVQVEQGPNSLPTCFQRSEWLGEILAQGKDPSKLVKAAAQIDPTRPKPGWLLQYTRLETKLRRKTEYTAKTFLSCIAQAIPSPAALNPRDASTTLLILDIADDYVLLKLDSTKRQMEGALGCWLKRPFQYSSSINQNVAEIVIDIVLSLIPKPNDAIKLLDPTCGRGTFLAHALSRGLCYVEGWDINAACTEGSVRNLEFCFSDEVSHKWNLFRRDATAPCKTGQMRDYDCVVANLPWGENSIA
jgi:hypothetical protein